MSKSQINIGNKKEHDFDEQTDRYQTLQFIIYDLYKDIEGVITKT